jgi:hypothetical protein
MAVFDDGTKTHFGLKGAFTFADGAPESKRNAYIARHRVNEDWTDPTKAGTLSRFILWEKKGLNDAIDNFKKKFGV